MSADMAGSSGGRKVWRDILVAALLGAVVTGIFLYYRSAGREDTMAPNDFNFQTVKALPKDAPPAGGPASGASMPTGSPLPWGVLPGPKPAGGHKAAKGMASARTRVKELAQGQEARVAGLAMKYTRRHAVIREYGQEWMSHPDLRRLNMDYIRDRDAVKFAFGAASSANFSALVQKYAGRREMHAFIIDVIAGIPGELMAALSDYLHQDRQAKALAQRFAATAELPPGVVASLELEPADSKKDRQLAATKGGKSRK